MLTTALDDARTLDFRRGGDLLIGGRTYSVGDAKSALLGVTYQGQQWLEPVLSMMMRSPGQPGGSKGNDQVY